MGMMPAGGMMPMGTMPKGIMPMGRMPGGNMPGGIMPGGNMPGGIMPGGNMPGGIIPMGRMPGSGMPPGGLLPGALPGAITNKNDVKMTTEPSEVTLPGNAHDKTAVDTPISTPAGENVTSTTALLAETSNN